ncbi:MAG TPA: SGNH hydrolase domain-containing protein [Acidimicrobiales bacterium]|nr:SGNH hydrolase domain-containing protein [Acidimicrobiales bacterium]
MTGRGGRGLLAAVSALLVAVAPAAVVAPAPAGAAPATQTPSGGGARAASPLPPGLGAQERAALEQAGAYGGDPVRLLLVGDSIAMTLGVGLRVKSRPRYGVTILNHTTLGCDLDPGLDVRLAGVVAPATPGCRGWAAQWPLLVDQIRPQVAALGLGRWEVADHLFEGRWVHIGEPLWDAHLETELQQAIAILGEFGARVVLFTMPYVDPSDRQPDGQPWSENTRARARAYNALVEQVARSEPGHVSVIDLNKMLDPDGAYCPTVDGVRVRWTDGVHVSRAGGLLLQGQILPVIGRIGLEDEAAARTPA